MGDVIDLAEQKRSRHPPLLMRGPVDETEHLGTIGEARISLAVLPETDPGWVHVVLSRGIGTPVHGIFAAPDRTHGANVARIVGQAVIRALRAVSPDGADLQPEPYTPDEMALNEEIIRAGDASREEILARSPQPAPNPDGAA